jgi:hypothetical protein
MSLQGLVAITTEFLISAIADNERNTHWNMQWASCLSLISGSWKSSVTSETIEEERIVPVFFNQSLPVYVLRWAISPKNVRTTNSNQE